MNILYSTGCPKCKELKLMLDKANIEYETNTSIPEMLQLGFKEVPMLKIGDKIMNFKEAKVFVMTKLGDNI